MTQDEINKAKKRIESELNALISMKSITKMSQLFSFMNYLYSCRDNKRLEDLQIIDDEYNKITPNMILNTFRFALENGYLRPVYEYYNITLIWIYWEPKPKVKSENREI